MSKFNLLTHIQVYNDENPSNNTMRNLAKWTREIQGIECDKAKVEELILAPGETRQLFEGSRTLLQDNTTEYTLSLKSGTTGTYILENTDGTAPGFRTLRTIAHDATSEITITKNGPIAVITASGGTIADFSSVAVGDEVVLGSNFNAANQGQFKILSKTSTSISIENSGANAEGPIVLGLDFANQLRIFSSSGVQVGDNLRIFGGFSIVSQNTYQVTQAQDNKVEFFFSGSLPTETVITQSIAFYSSFKQFVYIETDKNISLNINGQASGTVEPFIVAGVPKPGIFMKKSSMWSFSISNDTIDSAKILLIAVE